MKMLKNRDFHFAENRRRFQPVIYMQHLCGFPHPLAVILVDSILFDKAIHLRGGAGISAI